MCPSRPIRARHFNVLHDKSVAVNRVALCPKMDLIAVITTDGKSAPLYTFADLSLAIILVMPLDRFARCLEDDLMAEAVLHFHLAPAGMIQADIAC
jgi:hypothetical protein